MSMTDYVPPQVPPNHTQINRTVAEVAHSLKKDRQLGGLWRNVTSEKIRERGEAYMDASRILIEHCHPMMPPNDKDTVMAKYKIGRSAMASLDNSGASGIRKIQEARNARALCKKAYLIAKGASDRALDRVLDPLGGADPSAGASPATPELEEPDGTVPPAGASPGTTEEPDGSSQHDTFTDSRAAATSSKDESIEDIETTLPSGAAGIGVPADDASESYSFFYDPGLAASETSIASYKTEKTVNSRKSRYNVLPRHKYADHGYLRPQVPGSLGDTSVPKTELRDEHIDEDDESPPTSQSAPPTSPGPSPGTRPSDGPADTEPIHDDTPSRPPTPHRGVAFLTAILTGLASGAHEAGDVDLFGFDSEVYTD